MLVPLMRWWPRWWRRCAGVLAGSRVALAQEDLAQARERIAELEARLRHSPRNSYHVPSSPLRPPAGPADSPYARPVGAENLCHQVILVEGAACAVTWSPDHYPRQ